MDIVLRQNPDDTIDAIGLTQAVEILSRQLSATEYDNRLHIAAELVGGRLFRVNGCTYQYAPKLRLRGRSIPAAPKEHTHAGTGAPPIDAET